MADQPVQAGLPPLPRTWRPFGPRLAALVFGLILVGAFAWLWLRFDDETRAAINVLERATVIFFVLLGLVLLNGLARSRVIARADGLTIVNGYRRRRLAWSEVGTLRFPQGAPWPHLEQGEDERISLLGIQASDGARAATAVKELRALLAAHRR